MTTRQWRSSWGENEHAAAVEAVRSAIADGEVYQVNLVRHWQGECPDERAAAWALVGLGARHAGSMVGDGWSVHCASPELALSVSGSVVRTEPIKGTDEHEARLRASLKDRAEHVMIVDLERNDLAHVADPGSVQVDELYAVRPWAGLHHAHSGVHARLQAGATLSDVLLAVLPGGSVTGAPKSSALRLLHELEPVGRGPAMGAMGWITPEGDVELALTIRTIACDHRRAQVHLWAGGGVTWSSSADGEVREALAKARPLFRALAME